MRAERRGVTLVELLVTMTILTLLAGFQLAKPRAVCFGLGDVLLHRLMRVISASATCRWMLAFLLGRCGGGHATRGGAFAAPPRRSAPGWPVHALSGQTLRDFVLRFAGDPRAARRRETRRRLCFGPGDVLDVGRVAVRLSPVAPKGQNMIAQGKAPHGDSRASAALGYRVALNGGRAKRVTLIGRLPRPQWTA